MAQWILLAALFLMTGAVVRRIRRLDACGKIQMAVKLYRRTALALGLAAWIALALQETALAVSGMISWRTALPLHLCSVMGLLVLPMLLSQREMLWHASLLLGLPGGLSALIFPAMLVTSVPFVTTLGFHLLHAVLVIAPLVPFALGKRPTRRFGLHAWLVLMILASICLTVNHLTGGNYLFLSVPVRGTPLEFLARGGIRAYRLALMALAGVFLLVQGSLYRLFLKKS